MANEKKHLCVNLGSLVLELYTEDQVQLLFQLRFKFVVMIVFYWLYAMVFILL